MDLSSSFDIAISHGHNAIIHLALADSLGSPNINSGIENIFKRREEFKHLTASIFLFQGMMEAIINNAIETNSSLNSVGGSFKRKWEDSLKTLGEKTDSFLTYHKEIYLTYRNPLVHPKVDNIKTLNNISFTEIYNGLQSGWFAFDELNNGLGTPSDVGSWGILCRANNLRDSL